MSVAKTEKVGFVDRVKKLYRGVTNEMKKVHWPNRKELTAYTAIVLVSVFIVALAIWLIDSGLGFIMGLLMQ